MSERVLCIAGKSQAAVDVLAAAGAMHNVRLVCLPNASDNGMDDWQPSLRRAAEERSIPVASLDELMHEPDLCFVSVEYDRILRPARFRSRDLFNIHFSLLPKFRGCNTAVWPILLGETEHGVTLHEIDAGVDTGPIIAQRAFSIGPGATARDLYFECLRLGADLVIEWLPRLISGDYQSVAQRDEQAFTFARSDLDFSRKEVDLSQSTEQVMRQIRAFTFPEYQRPTYQGVDILAATLGPGGEGVEVRTADGSLRLLLAS